MGGWEGGLVGAPSQCIYFANPSLSFFFLAPHRRGEEGEKRKSLSHFSRVVVVREEKRKEGRKDACSEMSPSSPPLSYAKEEWRYFQLLIFTVF